MKENGILDNLKRLRNMVMVVGMVCILLTGIFNLLGWTAHDCEAIDMSAMPTPGYLAVSGIASASEYNANITNTANGLAFIAARMTRMPTQLMGPTKTPMPTQKPTLNPDTAQWNASKLQGVDISANTPVPGYVLTASGGDWVPAVLPNPSPTLAPPTPAPTINPDAAIYNAKYIQGSEVVASTPAHGQVIHCNITGYWAPYTLPTQKPTLNPDTALWNASEIQGFAVSGVSTPSNDDLLMFDHGTWVNNTIPTATPINTQNLSMGSYTVSAGDFSASNTIGSAGKIATDDYFETDLGVKIAGTPIPQTKLDSTTGVLMAYDGSAWKPVSYRTITFLYNALTVPGTAYFGDAKSSISNIYCHKNEYPYRIEFYAATAPGSGKSYIATLDKSGTATELVATMSGTIKMASDTCDVGDISADDHDYWNLDITGTGSPAAIAGYTVVYIAEAL